MNRYRAMVSGVSGDRFVSTLGAALLIVLGGAAIGSGPTSVPVDLPPQHDDGTTPPHAPGPASMTPLAGPSSKPTPEITPHSAGATTAPLQACIDANDSLALVPHIYDTIWTYGNQAQQIDPRLALGANDSVLTSAAAAVVPGLEPKNGKLIPQRDGTFIYVPTYGYTGFDQFTCQFKGAVATTTHRPVTPGEDVESNYVTVFIEIRPMPLSLSIDQRIPGDPNATLVLDPTAGSSSTLNLNLPPFLPEGSQVTLKLTKQKPADPNTIGGPGQPNDLVQVLDPNDRHDDPDGRPPGAQGRLVLGSNARESAGESVKWSVAGPGNWVPNQLKVSGNASGSMEFEVEVLPGDNNDPANGAAASIFGDICVPTPSQ